MRIIVWHGESKTLFYIAKPISNGEWEHIVSFSTRDEAEAFVKNNGYCCKCGKVSYYDSVKGYCWYHHNAALFVRKLLA